MANWGNLLAGLAGGGFAGTMAAGANAPEGSDSFARKLFEIFGGADGGAMMSSFGGGVKGPIGAGMRGAGASMTAAGKRSERDRAAEEDQTRYEREDNAAADRERAASGLLERIGATDEFGGFATGDDPLKSVMDAMRLSDGYRKLVGRRGGGRPGGTAPAPATPALGGPIPATPALGGGIMPGGPTPALARPAPTAAAPRLGAPAPAGPVSLPAAAAPAPSRIPGVPPGMGTPPGGVRGVPTPGMDRPPGYPPMRMPTPAGTPPPSGGGMGPALTDIFTRLTGAGGPLAPGRPLATPSAGDPLAGALDEARKAIADGADPAAVRKRLEEMGIDPRTL